MRVSVCVGKKKIKWKPKKFSVPTWAIDVTSWSHKGKLHEYPQTLLNGSISFQKSYACSLIVSVYTSFDIFTGQIFPCAWRARKFSANYSRLKLFLAPSASKISPAVTRLRFFLALAAPENFTAAIFSLPRPYQRFLLECPRGCVFLKLTVKLMKNSIIALVGNIYKIFKYLVQRDI